MKSIRFKKDIGFNLPVLTNGEAVDLAGRDILVVIQGPFGFKKEPEFTVTGNTLHFSLPGTEQQQPGIHKIIVWENKGKSGETLVDGEKAFDLVPSTDDEGGETEDLEVDSVDLSAVDLEVGIKGEDGASAYEVAVRNGFTGTEQQWLASLKATVTFTVEGDTLIINN